MKCLGCTTINSFPPEYVQKDHDKEYIYHRVKAKEEYIVQHSIIRSKSTDTCDPKREVAVASVDEFANDVEPNDQIQFAHYPLVLKVDFTVQT